MFFGLSTSLDHHHHDIGARPRCLCGKADFATEGMAKRAIKSLRAHGKERRGDGILHPYRCPTRRHIWHIGHTEES